MNSMNNSLDEIVSDVIDYVKLKYDFARLDIVEKVSILVSTIFLFMVLMLLALAGLIYLSAAGVVLLGDVLGSYIWSLTIMGGLFLLVCVLIYWFRVSLIVNPVVRFMVKLFFRNTRRKELGDE